MKTFSLSEVEVNRTITEEYLAANSFRITLRRQVRTQLPSGGYDTSFIDLVIQDFAIIGPQAGLRRAPEVPANIGEIASYNLTLLGRYNADVRDNDEFTLDEGRYRVDFVFPDTSFRTAAVIVYKGRVDG